MSSEEKRTEDDLEFSEREMKGEEESREQKEEEEDKAPAQESEAEMEEPEIVLEEPAEGEEDDSSAKEEKKGFFSKKNKKDPYKEKLEELQDKYTRQIAEFDNFRKRTEKEKQQMFDSGASSILTRLLPVIDNFERGFASVEESDREDAFVEGMNKVYKQLMDELEKIGVSPIEAVGQEFDPTLHNAVMQVDTGEFASGIVAQEMLRGYKYRDTVLRHSMVGVQQ